MVGVPSPCIHAECPDLVHVSSDEEDECPDLANVSSDEEDEYLDDEEDGVCGQTRSTTSLHRALVDAGV